MLFPVPAPDALPPGHAGYLAGRYRDGAWSDIWTDVSRCAERTFTGYAPACSCGWRGPGQPATDIVRLACRRIWLREHVAALPDPVADQRHRAELHAG